MLDIHVQSDDEQLLYVKGLKICEKRSSLIWLYSEYLKLCKRCLLLAQIAAEYIYQKQSGKFYTFQRCCQDTPEMVFVI